MNKKSFNNNAQSKALTTKFIDAVISKDKKGAESTLKEMINNHIGAKIRKAAHTEELI